MNITIMAIGKTKSGYLKEGIDTYLKRLRRYIPLDIIEIPDIKNAGRISADEQKEAEGTQFLSNLSGSDHVVLLDERGSQYTSIDFSKKLESIMASGKKRLVLIIGGPYGFAQKVYERANEMFSLSKMTFNHEMVRLFAVEQIYRAMTILRGEPYHHE